MAGRRQTFELAQASPRASRTMATRDEADDDSLSIDPRLHNRTLRKLDWVLLPFLAILFLFNAIDKSNIGNAESAHFTSDIGLDRSDLNTAVALFFTFFVSLQPVGAAVGRKYGMVAAVPTCMLLWGVCTALHVWVRHRWQLYALRILIGVFEAGFYPVTVTYLSLFYTRFEFGKRLSLFYGQAALGGALGGIISYIVFSRFRSDDGKPHPGSTWRPWQILFLLEGSLTMAVAVMGYFWLPHSVETAWFLSPEERQYAASRVLRDRDIQVGTTRIRREEEGEDGDEEQRHGEEARGLLTPFKGTNFQQHRAALDDRGLTPRDLFSSIFNLKIWHLLTCNILSAIPVYAFSVFLPLVLAPLTKKSNPALVNLLTAPPHLCGAVVLFTVAHYSDKYRIRLIPVLFGLVIMLLGLTLVVILPTSWAIPRYLALNLLLSGTYVASPLTVAWISNNSPTPGKRALLLGINGWGNFAGVLAAMLFKPKYAASGYIIPFIWTFVSVTIAFGGYILFLSNLRAINAARKNILDRWSEEAIELERREGTGPLVQERRWIKRVSSLVRGSPRLAWFAGWLDEATQGGREGDEKITFEYGL